MSLPLVKYVLTGAIRDRLVVAMVIALILSSSLAIFLGSSAVIEKDQFSIVFAAAGLRFISILGLVLFVVFFIRRSFEAKDIEFMLSRPIGRLVFIFSHALSIWSNRNFYGIPCWRHDICDRTTRKIQKGTYSGRSVSWLKRLLW